MIFVFDDDDGDDDDDDDDDDIQTQGIKRGADPFISYLDFSLQRHQKLEQWERTLTFPIIGDFWLEVALGSEQNRDITSWSLENWNTRE